MAVGREDGLVDTVHMLFQVLYLLVVLLRKTVARGVGNVHHGGSGLDDRLHHPCQILIVRTARILAVELHIVYKPLGIFHGRHAPLDHFLTGRVKLILNVIVARAQSCVYAFPFGILQRLHRHVDVLLHRACQRTNGGPRHSLRNLNHRMEIAGTRNGKSCLYHIDAQLLQSLGHLYFLDGVQLASWHLLAVTQGRVENK